MPSGVWRSGTGQSGLDLKQGNDRNTVVKISRPVAVPPRSIAGRLMALDWASRANRWSLSWTCLVSAG